MSGAEPTGDRAQRSVASRTGFGVLQRLGRSLMLPIAALPVAALLGEVAWRLLHWPRVVGLTSPPMGCVRSRSFGRSGVNVYTRLRALMR